MRGSSRSGAGRGRRRARRGSSRWRRRRGRRGRRAPARRGRPRRGAAAPISTTSRPSQYGRAPASSAPIRRPDSRARARSGSRPCSSASARRPKSRAATRSGRARPSSTAWRKSGSDQPSGATVLRSTDGVGEEGEDLAGHVAGEADDLAGGDVHPFGVGAGQAGDAVEAGLAGEEAGDLGLLAAHDVGRGVLAQAGQDADGEARVGRRRAGEGGRAGGAGHGGVGRLDPGAAGAGHAADDDVGAPAGREPGVDEARGARARRRRGARLEAPSGAAASARVAPSAAIAQARRFDVPQSTAIQSAVIRGAPRRRRRRAPGR